MQLFHIYTQIGKNNSYAKVLFERKTPLPYEVIEYKDLDLTAHNVLTVCRDKLDTYSLYMVLRGHCSDKKFYPDGYIELWYQYKGEFKKLLDDQFSVS